MSEQNTPTLSDDEPLADYSAYFLECGGDLNYIAEDDLNNAFRHGRIMAISEVITIINTMPFSMNLEVVKDKIKNLR